MTLSDVVKLINRFHRPHQQLDAVYIDPKSWFEIREVLVEMRLKQGYSEYLWGAKWPSANYLVCGIPVCPVKVME